MTKEERERERERESKNTYFFFAVTIHSCGFSAFVFCRTKVGKYRSRVTVTCGSNSKSGNHIMTKKTQKRFIYAPWHAFAACLHAYWNITLPTLNVHILRVCAVLQLWRIYESKRRERILICKVE